MDSGMGAGTNIRLQVSLAILTGVLVIVVTTAVVIIMGRAKSNADNLDAATGPMPTLASAGLPTLAGTPRATKSTGPTSPSPTLVLSCEKPDMTVSATMYCTVSITPPTSSTLTVMLHASTADVALPGRTSILARATFSDPFLISGKTSSGGATTLTAKAIGLTAAFSVRVTAG